MMGWLVFDGIDPHHDHEGHAIANERDRETGAWRELGPSDRDHDPIVIWMQLGCSCGWRSQRITTPLGAEWCNGELTMSNADQEALACVWRLEHRDQLGRLPHLVREARHHQLYAARGDADATRLDLDHPALHALEPRRSGDRRRTP